MSNSKKLVALIINFFACISLLVVGVFAFTHPDYSFNGSLSYTAIEDLVYFNQAQIKNIVSQNDNGTYSSQDEILSNIQKSLNKNETKIEFDLSDYKVLAGETIEIVLTLQNLTPNYLKTNLSYQSLPSGVTVRSTSLYLPQNTTGDLDSTQNRDFTIYITNNNSSSFNLSSLNLNVSFEEFSSLVHTAYQSNGTTVDYYYVEMGTIPSATGSEYIKWRYISSNGTSKYTGSKPTTTNGYYVLETDTSAVTSFRKDGSSSNTSTPYSLPQVCFNNNFTGTYSSTISKNIYYNINNSSAYANDYYYSTLRQYIVGNKVYKQSTTNNTDLDENGKAIDKIRPNTNSHCSDMLTDYCIDVNNDLIYNMITGRTIQSLYSNISTDGNALASTAHYAPGLGVNMSQTDKFWIPSMIEITNLGISLTWGRATSSVRGFHTRTPYPNDTATNSIYVTDESDLDGINSNNVKNNNRSARPAFII